MKVMILVAVSAALLGVCWARQTPLSFNDAMEDVGDKHPLALGRVERDVEPMLVQPSQQISHFATHDLVAAAGGHKKHYKKGGHKKGGHKKKIWILL